MKKYIAIISLLTFHQTATFAELLSDGDFNSLPSGNNPSANLPAGSWFFPENYLQDGVGETNLSQFTVSTDPFTGSGRCLRLEADASFLGNQHLVNVFTSPATSSNLTLQVDFDIYVSPGRGGGAVYLGNGSYGVRGPQLVWFPDGSLVAVDQNSSTIPLTNSYPRGVWQSVRLVIDLPSGSYGCYWAERGQSLVLLASGLTYRSGFQSSLDRMSVARFEAVPDALAWYDNFSVNISGVTPQPPQIIQAPPSMIMIPPTGYSTNLEVGVIGDIPFFYQWYQDGQAILNATEVSYPATHESWDTFNGNNYFVVVSNSFGAVTSSWFYVVQGTSPYIFGHPQPAKAQVGAPASFSANVIGNYVLGFATFPLPEAALQWYKDGVPLDGKTNATLTISSAQFSDAGDYNLTASNLWGQVVSVSAHLTVLPTFGLTISPVPPNKVIISFSTESGFQYVTETTPDLISGSWSAIATNIGTGLLTTVTNVTTVPASFYRTRVE